MDSWSQRGMAAMNPMLLQHTLRGLCSNDSQWVYAVFWRILPRNYPPPRWDMEGGVMDRSKGNRRNWILVWEDGYCNFSACSSVTASDSRPTLGASFFSVPHLGSNDESQQQFSEPAMNPELFFKMSHDAYNFGEGLIGKVAVDKSHKWVYHEPLESETSYITPWNSDIDPHPRTWEGQFKAGIQTIAVIAVEEGVLQLGSTKKVMEDLNFVLYMQRKFNFLHSVPGAFVPHPTSSGGTFESLQRPSPDSISAMANSQSDVTGSSEQFLFPGVAPDPWHPIITPIAGNVRPDPESSESLNSNQYSFSYGSNHEGSPSPPEAQSHIIPHTLKPSMSSLQALLSKLPSVTGPLDSNNTGAYLYPSNSNLHNSGNGNLYLSNRNFGGKFSGFNGNQLPAWSSDGSDLRRLVDGECRVISPTAYSSVGTSVGEDGEFESQNHVALDNFSTEFGISEALENGDSSYSSFLNDMCS